MKLPKKLFILWLFAINFQLFSNEISFSCKYKDIPFQATGTYTCNFECTLSYDHPAGYSVEILKKSPFLNSTENLQISKNEVTRATKDYFDNDFYAFDKEGNLYFIGTLSYTTLNYLDYKEDYITGTDVLFLYKYNPVTSTVEYIELNKNSVPHSFCLSKNGKWAFVDVLENIDEQTGEGNPSIYAVSTDFNTEPVLIFSLYQKETAGKRNLRNLCFDSNTNTLYFSLKTQSYNNEISDCYSLKIDSDESINISNLSKESVFSPKSSYKLYSNNEGLWGVKEGTKSENYSQLIHLKDMYGAPVKDIKKNHKEIKIYGNWNFTPNLLVEEDYILYLNETKSKIFKLSKGKQQDVTSFSTNKAPLTYEDLRIVNEKIIKDINSEDAFSFMESVSAKILLSIISVLLIVIIVLVILVMKLNDKSNQLKKDKKFVFDVQESERGKISRDIHDSVIQDIRAIRIETELLTVAAESETRKNKIIDMATDCVVKLRNICYNLTPAELATHEDGTDSKKELVSIIQSLVVQFIEQTHIPCYLKIDENFDYPVLDIDVSQNLFRIVQESLTNIQKHSYATSCQILIKNKIEDDKTFMCIYISDDGIGCDVKQLQQRKSHLHYGIRNMKDRASLIGASISFQSEPGQGLEVTIKI